MNNKNSDFLELVPEHNVRWENTANGEVCLWSPKYTHPFMVKYLLPLLKKKETRITLDQYGSFAWMQIDGKKNIRQIGAAMLQEFGEKIEPVEQRLGIFINIMLNRKLLSVH
ncbi:MAG TPA: PqqD family protein [bacterium]|nr:PqqD family protein [bacterium]HPN43618.1 PqqD family protein [bacterium]